MNISVTVVIAFLAALLVAAGAASPVLAQRGGVVESQGVVPGVVPERGPERGPQRGDEDARRPVRIDSDNEGLSLLFEQLQALQAEVQALRALAEEQAFEIRRLQEDSAIRYTDIDERLINLESSEGGEGGAGGGAAGASAITPRNSPAVTVPRPGSGRGGIVSTPIGDDNTADSDAVTYGADGSGRGGITSSSLPANNDGSRGSRNSRPALEPAVISEQQLYQMAHDSVINEDFERSVAEFDQYLSAYPEGRFAPNSHYWKGQAFLNLGRYEEAQESYSRILEDYPEDSKAGDAMFGLAQAYQGMGDTDEARRILDDIKRRYPNTGLERLADRRLLELE